LRELLDTYHVAMAEAAAEATRLHHLGFEAFGVRVALAAPSRELLRRAEPILPPGWQPIEPTPEDHHFTLSEEPSNRYRLHFRDGSVSGSADLQIALEVLDARIRAYVALHAPDYIFVHAGVVSHRGRAIVLPGSSFAGKTTLVAALIQAGATYYSDEFAVLDSEGLVHPYPKPLSIRIDGPDQVDHSVAAFGAVVGVEPVPVGLVVISQYGPEAEWIPERLSAGEAVLGVLQHTVPAQERPEQSLAAIRKAISGAVTLHSQRGDAAGVAPKLLALLAE
jgi:hypothetical protein